MVKFKPQDRVRYVDNSGKMREMVEAPEGAQGTVFCYRGNVPYVVFDHKTERQTPIMETDLELVQ